MDQRRLELHELLKTIVKNVYFEPPEDIQLKYPCIVYHRNTGDTKFANNRPYNFRVRYNMVLMDTDPDSEYFEQLASLPECNYTQHYTTDGVCHDAFNIYY